MNQYWINLFSKYPCTILYPNSGREEAKLESLHTEVGNEIEREKNIPNRSILSGYIIKNILYIPLYCTIHPLCGINRAYSKCIQHRIFGWIEC